MVGQGGGLSTAAANIQTTNGSNFTTYNTETTAGVGVVYELRITNQKSETGADASLLSLTPASAAGTYRISFILDVSAISATSIGWTATWTNSNGTAQSPANLSLYQSGTAAPGLLFNSTGSYYGSAIVDVNSSGTAIVVKLTFNGTSLTAKASAIIERLL